MKSLLKKVIAIVLVISISLVSIAFAADDEKDDTVQPKSSAYIDSYSGKITPLGNGRFNIVFTVVGTGTMTQIGASYIRIFKNGTQVDGFSYTSSGRSGMMAYNTFAMGDTESSHGTPGATYYAKISFYAKNSSGYDMKVYTTASVII